MANTGWPRDYGSARTYLFMFKVRVELTDFLDFGRTGGRASGQARVQESSRQNKEQPKHTSHMLCIDSEKTKFAQSISSAEFYNESAHQFIHPPCYVWTYHMDQRLHLAVSRREKRHP